MNNIIYVVGLVVVVLAVLAFFGLRLTPVVATGLAAVAGGMFTLPPLVLPLSMLGFPAFALDAEVFFGFFVTPFLTARAAFLELGWHPGLIEG